jgi:hypothetical protein
MTVALPAKRQVRVATLGELGEQMRTVRLSLADKR